MFPEDRVLVAYVPQPADFARARDAHWYRIPQAHAPKGIHAEYIAFYFGRHFGQQKWAIHYFAANRGHELARRVDLIPAEPRHPRAHDLYYKLQLGEMQALERPIPSLRWRRILFIHTTWDRFRDAVEINDLFQDGDAYVNRLYATLKEHGVQPERHYRVEESGSAYDLPLSIPCRHGRVDIPADRLPRTPAETAALATAVLQQVAALGGTQPVAAGSGKRR